MPPLVSALPPASWVFLWLSPIALYVLYLLAMAGFLAVCGVQRAEIAKWALRQADRQRFTDLIRAARGLPDRPELAVDMREPRLPSE